MSLKAVLEGDCTWHVEQGDVREVLKRIPWGTIQTVVTSPPYWGLRDYGLPETDWADGWRGQLGLEPDPFMFVRHLVEVFSVVKRVLRDDGTVWLNLGDSYSTKAHGPLKQKDLVGIPWRVAFALQEDGWYLRSGIVWDKPSTVPESTLDRPTSSHEYVFLLAKSERYFFDIEAVLEGAERRRPRTVWRIATQPFKEAHFAVFPPALVERPILAATSEAGECRRCHKPHTRVTEVVSGQTTGRTAKQAAIGVTQGRVGARAAVLPTLLKEGDVAVRKTVGWEPSCSHKGEPQPQVVLDPFSGSGTTGVVARRLGRAFIGVDLSEEYVEMARHRIEGDQPLLNEPCP